MIKIEKNSKKIKNSDKITEKLYLSNFAEVQVKFKQKRKKLNKIINEFEINETPLPEGGVGFSLRLVETFWSVETFL